jgi:hypothetical protein
MTETQIIPEWYTYRRDVSDGYTHSEEGRALLERCGGKIYEIYVFDFRRHVCCCEITPSYELWYVESIPGGEEPEGEYDQDLDEVLRDANRDNEPVIYIHTRDIDEKGDGCKALEHPVEWWNDLVEDNDDDTEAAYLKAVDDVVEAYNANPEW